ncbi:lipopolysaccharide biosynthesis protein [Candidatus Cetobacterium colombiensis]|uniref:Polysaccharide biosynthesis protein n=1 Tax=Candidatus Cetobacterium colombiensis TaxID=3073100 RepID=A0ABU4W8U5_9FUSO|nr:oligosaccharide flippase family protein [Candidatus Cetobacterium colombiensis]MDX8335951.1 polysaccharide biosynthesis protein [Candidatus Cetobacterium colombiensis]
MDENRGIILRKHLSLGFIYKILGMGLSYISVPLFLEYLGEKDYGLWMVIFSTISWIFMFDLGIGNGLKNKLTQCLVEKNILEAKKYITTGYIVLSVIALVIFIVGFLGIQIFNIKNLLSLDNYNEYFLKKLILIVFVITILNFIVGLYKIFYIAEHNSTIGNFSNLLFQSFFLCLLIILKKINLISLINIGIIYPGINLIIGIFFTVKYFKKHKELIPKFQYFDKEKIKSIGGTGIEFFIIQISMLIILTTDNLIITKLLGVEAVTPYNIISKLFQSFLVLSGIILMPLWTLFLDAYLKKDKKWILKTLKKLNILYLILCIGILITIFLTPLITKIWLQKTIEFPKYLILFWGMFILIRVYGDIYMYFVNGIGKIRLQTILYVIGAIVNVPLSIYFVKNFNLGSSGVILATNISMLPLSIFIPIQTYKIIKKI